MVDVTAGISTVIQDIQGTKNGMLGMGASQVSESGNTFSARRPRNPCLTSRSPPSGCRPCCSARRPCTPV